MLGYLKPLSMADVARNALTIAIPASEDLLDRSGTHHTMPVALCRLTPSVSAVNVQGNIGSCKPDVSWVLDAAGNALAANWTALTWSPILTPCNYTSMQQRQNQLSDLLTARAALPLNSMQEALTAIWSAGSVTGSLEVTTHTHAHTQCSV